jgi:hypothetical protein
VPSYGADGLECPQIGPNAVPDLIGDASGSGLPATDKNFDLVNDVNDAIARLQVAHPNISAGEMQDVLIAAYCRVVAGKSGLSAAEKWRRMHQFEGIVERQIAANIMPAGTMILANVPLAPDVYRELKRQAATSGQTISQLMAAILTQAAGK